MNHPPGHGSNPTPISQLTRTSRLIGDALAQRITLAPQTEGFLPTKDTRIDEPGIPGPEANGRSAPPRQIPVRGPARPETAAPPQAEPSPPTSTHEAPPPILGAWVDTRAYNFGITAPGNTDTHLLPRPGPTSLPMAQTHYQRIEFRLVPSNPMTMPLIIVPNRWLVLGQKPMDAADQLEPMLLAVIVNPYLSGRHLAAMVHENELSVCDLHSRNGSWLLVAGESEYRELIADQPHRVRCGDKIILGSQEVTYTVAVCEVWQELWQQTPEEIARTNASTRVEGTTQLLPRFKPRQQ